MCPFSHSNSEDVTWQHLAAKESGDRSSCLTGDSQQQLATGWKGARIFGRLLAFLLLSRNE